VTDGSPPPTISLMPGARPLHVIDRLPLADPDPGSTAHVRDAGGGAIACIADGNLLAAGHSRLSPTRAKVNWCWSGWLGEQTFASDPRTWMPEGRRAFRAAIDTLASEPSAAERRFIFIPHACHAVSDTPTCLALAKDSPNRPLGFALSPGTMIDEFMSRNMDDHLHRLFESLGSKCAAVLLPAPDMLARSAGRGSPDGAKRLADLLDGYVPRHTPAVASREDWESWQGLFRDA
jgi:hypothetical protein